MGWWFVAASLALVAVGGVSQEVAPSWVVEPPARLTLGAEGGAAGCVARGSPPPLVSWLYADLAPLHHAPNLRQVLDNGSLVFLPFSREASRSEVHAASYRCRAHNALGAILSREMRLNTVLEEEWTARVVASRAEEGGPALLTCGVPAGVRGRARVAAWYRDDAVLVASDSILIVDEGWQLVVRAVQPSLSRAAYTCSLLSARGERRRSLPASIPLAPASVGSAPRAVSAQPWEMSAREGADVALPCLVHSAQPVTYTWYRESAGGSLREIPAREGGGRYVRSREVLAVRRLEPGDAGRWACRAASPNGHATLRFTLHLYADLAAYVHPQIQVVNSGGTASMNCSWSGLPTPRVEWFHNGTPLGTGISGRVKVNGEQLIVRSVQRSDRGIYQCMLRNERDSAQASTELKLGDMAPELQYTFIEQVLRSGQLVTLKCSASGAPPPHFSWLLDAQPLNTMARGHRYSVEEFATKAGEVVGYLNISAVRSEDGGLYTCRAANSLGEVSHTSRLNIYGPPYVRAVGPINAVAGRELTLHCPYSGYPITSVKWEREGAPLAAGGAGGSLVLARVSPADAGAYSCSVSGPHGELARRDLQLVVANPPEIEPFSFSANLQEGKRAQISCIVTSGDMPVHFAWLKDNGPIPNSLQVEERGAEFFSNLVFKEVSAHHSGIYTCIASNAAAKVNYTAELVVKVSPKWVLEPTDTSVLAGEPVSLRCETTGSPPPQVVWLKQTNGQQSDFLQLSELGGRFHQLANGTLHIESVLAYDEGHYMCRADNGVGASISKIVLLSVNEAARFEQASQNVSARRDASATLVCDARGDQPLRIRWTHDMNALDLDSYRLSLSEAKTEHGLRSTLTIARATRRDSGAYRCDATNAYGHADHFVYLAVQELPEAPRALAVTELSSRAVRLVFTQGFDGNAPLLGFALQLAPLASPGAVSHAWDSAVTLNSSLQDARHFDQPITVTHKGGGHYEALVSGLLPHSAYMLRAAAYNPLGIGDYTEPLVLKTQEEAPASAGVGISAAALESGGGGGALAVRWEPPPRAAWHGDLLGYTLTVRDVTTPASNYSRTITIPGWSSSTVTVSGLRRAARYELRLRSFNAAAASPPSHPLHVSTLEGVPESPPQHVSCSTLSSSSLKVSWSPPPSEHHAGILQGYKVLYSPINSIHAEEDEVKRVSSTETYLHALHKYTNYSVQVLAFTGAGDGKRSPAIYCLTEEDVPSAPAKIKVGSLSSDSVLVSWLPPEYPNGVITHYTVYYRDASRGGKQSSQSVPGGGGGGGGVQAGGGGAGLAEVRGGGGALDVWVAASTARGEGDHTHVVTHQPKAPEAARVMSFGGVVGVGVGSSARLPCACAGVPAPRVRWTAPGVPPQHYTVRHDVLLLHEVTAETSGNYTCSASNSLGADAETYVVRAERPPAPPALQLHYATPNSLKVQWQPTSNGGAPILGYTVRVWEADGGGGGGGVGGVWEVGGAASSLVAGGLRCGRAHRAVVTARSRRGHGPPSAELVASTRGGRPKPPKLSDLFVQNSTAIKINLYSWSDNGCPILGFHISYRRAGAEHWIKVGDNMSGASHVISGLSPGAWYEVAVEAENEAGSDRLEAMLDTLTLSEGRAARGPPVRAAAWRGALGAALASGAAAAALGLALLAAACVWRQRRNRKCCSSNATYGREVRKLSESQEEREKLRDGQKLYSSSSINGNDKSNDDSSEVYEISPYATFGGGGGECESESALPLHYRSLRHSHTPRHATPPCDHYSFEESSLSASSTVEARGRARASRARDDRDIEHLSHSHSRNSHYQGARHGGAAGRRACRSDEGGLLATSLSLAPTPSSPTDLSTLIDKYQQRKEQERRECTIHV